MQTQVLRGDRVLAESASPPPLHLRVQLADLLGLAAFRRASLFRSRALPPRSEDLQCHSVVEHSSEPPRGLATEGGQTSKGGSSYEALEFINLLGLAAQASSRKDVRTCGGWRIKGK